MLSWGVLRQAAVLASKSAAGNAALHSVCLSRSLSLCISTCSAVSHAPAHALHASLAQPYWINHAPALQRFLSDLGELANVESGPLMQGRQMIMVVGPQKAQAQA